MKSDKTIMLFRHGSVVGGPGVYKGKGIDTPLSPQGETQTLANIAAFLERGRGRSMRLLASPALRCRWGLDCVSGIETAVWNNLEDVDIGDWACLQKADVARRWPEILQQIQKDARAVSILPGAGQSLILFRQQCHQGFNRILELPEQHVGLFTHGRVIEEILAYIRESAVQYLAQKEGAANIVTVQDGRVEVTAENQQIFAHELQCTYEGVT